MFPKHKLAVRRARHSCDVAIEQLLPADAVRPRWSSESALVYIGAIVALFATTSLLGILGEDHGNGALVGFAALATAAALALAVALERAGRLVAAGVLATLAVVFFAVFGRAGDTIGLLDDIGDNDWTFGRFLLELLTIAAASWHSGVSGRRCSCSRSRSSSGSSSSTSAPRRSCRSSPASSSSRRATLSTAPGGSRSASGSTSSAARRSEAACWRSSTASRLDRRRPALRRLRRRRYAFGRSSYAVLGAIGILATTTYFIQDGLAYVGVFVPVEVGDPNGGTDPWQIAL